MTVSNIISPLMGYLDRFLIGVTISAAAVAYYVTPNEMVTKLWIIPSAFTAVLFPKFASDIANNNPNSAALFKQAVALLFLGIYPIALFCALFSKEILKIWINPMFAAESYVVMQIFAFGILINCLAHVPYVLIQSAGKAKITAMIHVAEFVPFAIVLWLFATHMGILGAALAWLVRMLIDTVVMFSQVGKIIKKEKYQYIKLILLGCLVVPSFLAGSLPSSIAKGIFFLFSCFVVMLYFWYFLATQEERSRLVKKFTLTSIYNKP